MASKNPWRDGLRELVKSGLVLRLKTREDVLVVDNPAYALFTTLRSSRRKEPTDICVASRDFPDSMGTP